MAYDISLTERIYSQLQGTDGILEKKMFGGVGYLLNGNMACGVVGDTLIVRVGLEDFEAALSQPNTRLFDMTGRPLKGWIVVEPGGIEGDDDLQRWVKQGVEFAKTLPPK